MLGRLVGLVARLVGVLLVEVEALGIVGRAVGLVDEVARLGDVKLIPGMPVEAFVQTGDRTMMSYLVKPLQDQLMRAFREK